MATGDVSNFNAAVDALVQRGWLSHAFMDPLLPKERFGIAAERKPIQVEVGNTVTDTRPSFLPPKPTSVDPSQANGNDNGMVPDQYGIEQITLMLERFEGTQDHNVRTDPIGAIKQFPQKVRAMMQQSKSSIDVWKRDMLLGGNVPNLRSNANPQGAFRSVFGYLSGTTIVTAGTSSSTTCTVDDASGFDTVLVNGKPTAVSSSNPLPLLKAGVQIANITGVAYDGFSGGKWGTSMRRVGGVSIACGASGTLTLDTAVSFTSGDVITTPNAPLILRPNSKAHFSQLTSSDTLTARLFDEATSYLGDNSVPFAEDDFYIALGDKTGFSQLKADPDMKGYAQTRIASNYVRKGELDMVMGAALLPTTNAPFQPKNGSMSVAVRRIVIIGGGVQRIGPAAANEHYAAIARTANGLIEQTPNHWKCYDDDIVYNIRGPQDRQGETVSLSWNALNSASNPTDYGASSQITDTWSNAALKRAVVLEFAA